MSARLGCFFVKNSLFFTAIIYLAFLFAFVPLYAMPLLEYVEKANNRNVSVQGDEAVFHGVTITLGKVNPENALFCKKLIEAHYKGAQLIPVWNCGLPSFENWEIEDDFPLPGMTTLVGQIPDMRMCRCSSYCIFVFTGKEVRCDILDVMYGTEAPLLIKGGG